jgi:NAD(P)-dependent dehydrogenase (short-subunit alcohol dehydrogenase family)
MRLENKVALITGGYGGMGTASARLFAKEGATVFIAGRKKERGDLATEINASGGKAHFVPLDIVKQDQWDAAVSHVKDEAGPLHILMNIVGSVRLPKVDIDEWNKIFDINVTGTLRGIQTCAPLMTTGYSASKWALEGLSRSAAYIYADWGIPLQRDPTRLDRDRPHLPYEFEFDHEEVTV